MRPALLALLGVLSAFSLDAALAGQRKTAPVEIPKTATYREAVEADWFLQDKVRTLVRGQAKVVPGAGRNITPRADARGGVDGVKDGKWGFHTADEPNPWWHVDLGSKQPLDHLVLYNRCDTCGERNNRIVLSLSDDGKAWQKAYQHNGTPFGGQPDGKPLAIKLDGKAARFVRLALEGKSYFHLDEVEVYAAPDPKKNIALGKPADQSSTSEWSSEHSLVVAPSPAAPEAPIHPIDIVLGRGKKLADDLLAAGAPVQMQVREIETIAQRAKELPKEAPPDQRRQLYLDARWAVRRLAFANPLLSFDRLVFAERVPGSYSHMSDQHYGWWSRPGGGLFVLRNPWRGDPQVQALTASMPVGSVSGLDLSFDGTRIVFAWCRYYPDSAGRGNKVDKTKLPDDAFYHIFEINADGTGLRQITRGRYDDFDPRYLPDGRMIFLSTRRGQAVQVGRASAGATAQDPFIPNSYVRCGGGDSRPVPVFTLHSMRPDGSDLRGISNFENFEWTPSVADDGRILFARWDYIDRHNNAFMSLWSMHPDGTFPNLVFKNFTRSPHCAFEARSIPNSPRLMFTASAHHAITAGSICRLDVARCTEEQQPLTRLTPEVCFPETEGWPTTYYNNPFPLSENYFLTAWSPRPIHPEGGSNDTNSSGLYLADAFGNLELIHRNPAISSQFPIPLRPRPVPHQLPDLTDPTEVAEGRFLILNVYRGLPGIAPGTIRWIRIIGCPSKTQPHMNNPNIGACAEDPGKFVLGIVPVEADGSAYFRVPPGIAFFFQALDANGVAVQTMRTLTSVQPGQTLACIGCHEQRQETPPAASPLRLAAASSSVPENRTPNTDNRSSSGAVLALLRGPSPITPGPEGSWPYRFDRLVQPVLDANCVRCHSPNANPQTVAAATGGTTPPRIPPKGIDLTPAASYKALATYGGLHGQVTSFYLRGYSVPGQTATQSSALLAHLRKGHHGVQLDAPAYDRLITWMDTYAQFQGHFSPQQEQALEALRARVRSAGLFSAR